MLIEKNNSAANCELLIIRPSKSDAPKEHFEVSRKNKENKYVKEREVKSVSGDITKVDFVKKEWDGSVYTQVKLFVMDQEARELYLFSLSYTMATRGLLNALLNLESPENVVVSIWKNKKGYDAIGLEQNNERIGWKFGIDELPKPEEVEFKGKKMRDYDKSDAFLEDNVKEWAKNVLKGAKTQNVVEEDLPENREDDDDEEVPF